MKAEGFFCFDRDLIRVNLAVLALCLSLLFIQQGEAAPAWLWKQKPTGIDTPHEADNLPYALVLYDYFQDNRFKALNNNLVFQSQNKFGERENYAQLVLANLYLAYGLPEEAEAIFKSLLRDNIDKETQNKIWLNLARLYLETAFPKRALKALNKHFPSKNPSLEYIELKSHALVSLHRYEEAIALLNPLVDGSIIGNYAQYNMATAFLELGRTEHAISLLQELTDISIRKNKQYIKTQDEAITLRDEAAKTLGLVLIKEQRYAEAVQTLNKTSFSSPSIDQSLLGLGWAQFNADQTLAAANSWQILSKRNLQNRSVLQAQLLSALAFWKIENEERTLDALTYATDVYQQEIKQLKQLLAEVDDESWHKKFAPPPNNMIDPFIMSSELVSQHEEAFNYLYVLYSSNQFSETLRGYRQLQNIELMLHHWENKIPVFNFIVAEHQNKHEKLRPQSQLAATQIPLSDLQSELSSHKANLASIEKQYLFEKMADVKQNELLAMAVNSQDILAHAAPFQEEALNTNTQEDFFEKKEKLALLQGILYWQLNEQMPERLWNAKTTLKQSETALIELQNRKQGIAEIQEVSKGKFDGYDKRILMQDESLKSTLVLVKQIQLKHQNYLRDQARAVLNDHLDFVINLSNKSYFYRAQFHDLIFSKQNEQLFLDNPQENKQINQAIEDLMIK